MNINKYLKKLNIEFELIDNVFIFTLPDKTIKKIPQIELEQFLFIQMVEYIVPGHFKQTE